MVENPDSDTLHQCNREVLRGAGHAEVNKLNTEQVIVNLAEDVRMLHTATHNLPDLIVRGSLAMSCPECVRRRGDWKPSFHVNPTDNVGKCNRCRYEAHIAEALGGLAAPARAAAERRARELNAFDHMMRDNRGVQLAAAAR